MTFNSLAYLVFLPVVFSLYWLLNTKPLRWQNIFLLAASYLFYGWWDWRFLGLLLFSTAVDFTIGIWMSETSKTSRRRQILGLSLLINLGLLGFFKYFNFFTASFVAMAGQLGLTIHPITLQVILPVGISFYTFQSLSYTIDVYRERLPATRDFVAFAAYVTFFPQLVAGPIERAGHLLPQFLSKRTFLYEFAVSGCRLIAWGLLKKVVIADNLAPIADSVFNRPEQQNVWTASLGILCFAGQIYGDFSGYSDMAVGSARLFGFDLMQNFRSPYFSTSVREFWQRWHISLSSWFRDYVYIPLGGNRRGKFRQFCNLLITFALSGLWHGASWNFVVWGLWHGGLLGLETRFRSPESPSGFQKLGAGLVVFVLVCIGWVFFRAKTWDAACALFARFTCFSGGFSPLAAALPSQAQILALGSVIILFLWAEWKTGAETIDSLIQPLPSSQRWAFYGLLTFTVLLLGVFDNAPVFIYFQF